MRQLLLTILLAMALRPLEGARIDVSSEDQVTFEQGSSLAFSIGIWNFARMAGDAGASPYPTQISFLLSALPPWSDSAYRFGVFLESPDGRVSTPLNQGTPLGLATGYRNSYGYTGPVSVIMGSIDLTPDLAGTLFSDRALEPRSDGAVLVIRNLGDNLEIGLPGYTLAQNFSASLSSSQGSLHVGAVTNRVLATSVSETPEPASFVLALAGGATVLLARRITFSSR
jgi:hypothetical protein